MVLFEYMKNSQRGFIIPAIIAVIAVILIVGGVYYSSTKEVVAPNIQTPVVNNTQNNNSDYTPPILDTTIPAPAPAPAVIPKPVIRQTPKPVTTAPTPVQQPISSPVAPTTPAPSITIISPNGGEKFIVGQTIAIQFKIVNPSPTGISVSINDKNNNTTNLIVSSNIDANPNGATQTFNWMIQKDNIYTSNNSFRIQISAPTLGLSDYSDAYFMITR